jgi:hypothetical protein
MGYFFTLYLQAQTNNIMTNTTNNTELVEKRILGFTEEITSCDCCGKYDLKGTFAVDFEGDVQYYGSVCAFKVHRLAINDQKELKKAYKKRVKYSEQLAKMESEYNGSEYARVKMLKFVEAKGLDLNKFVQKYGIVCDENDYYTAYSFGCVVKLINK